MATAAILETFEHLKRYNFATVLLLDLYKSWYLQSQSITKIYKYTDMCVFQLYHSHWRLIRRVSGLPFSLHTETAQRFEKHQVGLSVTAGLLVNMAAISNLEFYWNYFLTTWYSIWQGCLQQHQIFCQCLNSMLSSVLYELATQTELDIHCSHRPLL